MESNKQPLQKGINLACKELKESLVQKINDSKLPIVNIKYILSDLLTVASSVEAEQIKKEQEEYDKQKEEKKEE